MARASELGAVEVCTDFAGGPTEASVVSELAQLAAAPAEVLVGEVYAVPDGKGGVKTLDTDAYAPSPRRAQGHRTVTDAASFVAYVNRHAVNGTEIYAHTNTSSVVAVIDSHEGALLEPGWQGHKLTLALEYSKAWAAWAAADGKLLDQASFADFLDDRYLDVLEPSAAEMIDIARTFQAKTNVTFESGIREGSGDVTLAYVEDTKAKAGQKGDIVIPEKIKLVLRPYVGGPQYFIWAKFRYRLNGGSVVLGFKLERPENILEAAFADIVTEIRDGKTEKRTNAETNEVEEARVHDGIGPVPIFNGRP